MSKVKAKSLLQLIPFRSSLIDTVKVRVELEHDGLPELANNANIRRNGSRYTVESRFDGARANIWSPASKQHLLIEASVPKFLTGQNLIGIHDMRQAVQELVTEVLDQAEIQSTREVRKALRTGDVELLRADVVVHCPCESGGAASTLMQSVRRLAIGLDKDTAMFKNETVYLGFTSRRRTLKLYRKDLELQVHPVSSDALDVEGLTAAAKHAVRIELCLRHAQLKDLALHRANQWMGSGGANDEEADTVVELLAPWIRKLKRLPGKVPSVAGLGDLSPQLALRLRAWLLGDADAFTAAPSTARSYRSSILAATGIDVATPLTVKQQRAALRSVREVLSAGVSFGDHSASWPLLKASTKPK